MQVSTRWIYLARSPAVFCFRFPIKKNSKFSKMNLVGQKDQSSPFTNSLEDDRLGPVSEDHYIATSSICTPFEHLQFHLDMTNAQYLMPSTHQQRKRLRVHGLTLPDTAACVSGPHTAAYSSPELVPFTVRSNVPFHTATFTYRLGRFRAFLLSTTQPPSTQSF